MKINILFLIIILGLMGYGVYRYKKSISNLNKSYDSRELEVKFILRMVFIILGAILLYFIVAPKAPLDSSVKLVENYLSESYYDEIKASDIENIFKKNNDEAKVVEFDLINLNEAKTKKLKIKLRKGSKLYNEYEYIFLVRPSHAEILNHE